MFVYTATAYYTDGTSTVYSNGYAASGIDELTDFHAEALKRFLKDADADKKVLAGYQLTMIVD